MAENENENVFIIVCGLQAKKQANKVEPMVPVSLSLSPISLTLSTPGLIPVSSLVPYCVLVSLLLTCFSHKIVEEMEEKATCPYVRPADV